MNAHLEPTTSLVNTGQDGQPTTTSQIIAEGTDSRHASVIRLIRDNLVDFEEFGRVGFEIEPFETAGGAQTRTVAILNREQAMLLMTYMRNNNIVRDFKKRLIKAFVELEDRLNQPQWELPQTFSEALRELAATYEAKEAAEAENRALKGGTGMNIKQFIKTYFVAPNERAFFEWLYFHGYLIDGRIYESDGRSARNANGPKLRWDHQHPTYIGRKYFKLVPSSKNPHGAARAKVIPERALDLVSLLLRADDLPAQMTQEGRDALDQYRAPGQLRIVQ